MFNIFKSDTIGALAKALASAQAEMGKARKDSTNPHFNSKYADLTECLDTVVPVFSKHGIAITQLSGTGPDGAVMLTTMLIHESGEFIGSESSMLPGKAGPHAVGSCLTYLRRYSLAAIAGLGQEDDDGNSGQGSAITAEQATQIIDMLNANSIDKPKFLAYMGAATVSEIASKDYNKAMTALRKKAAS